MDTKGLFICQRNRPEMPAGTCASPSSPHLVADRNWRRNTAAACASGGKTLGRKSDAGTQFPQQVSAPVTPSSTSPIMCPLRDIPTSSWCVLRYHLPNKHFPCLRVSFTGNSNKETGKPIFEVSLPHTLSLRSCSLTHSVTVGQPLQSSCLKPAPQM